MKLYNLFGAGEAKLGLPNDPYNHDRQFGNNLKNAQELVDILNRIPDAELRRKVLDRLCKGLGVELEMFEEGVKQLTGLDFSAADKEKRDQRSYSIHASKKLELTNGYTVEVETSDFSVDGRSGGDKSMSMELAPGYSVRGHPSSYGIRGAVTDRRQPVAGEAGSDKKREPRYVSFDSSKLVEQTEEATTEVLAALTEMRDVLRGYFIERSIGKVTDNTRKWIMTGLGVRLSSKERSHSGH